jgi:hypothetical protein
MGGLCLDFKLVYPWYSLLIKKEKTQKKENEKAYDG